MSARRCKLARKSVRCAHPESLEARLLLAEIAETLLVSVDATALPEGQVTSIPNTGTLTGVFEPTGGNAATVPVIGRPVATATSGTRGIRLDGNDFLQLLQSTGGDILPAPDGISGPNPTRSIEAWVWNPAIRDEETILSWGRRGGGDGTNMSFNYGANGAFGAVGHWGAPDIGWGTVPAARNWHHLVYTFDGTTSTTRVYVDGVQTNTEVLAANAINTPLATPINIGTQTAIPAGGTVPQPSDPALRGSLTIGRIRIHDGVLSPTQIQTNFNAEKADFVEPVIPGVPPPPLVKLVDVDPRTLPEGPVESIANTGTAGGFFAPTGGDPNTVPVIDQPVATATGGTVGIRMDGTDFLQHVDAAVDGAPVPSPAELVGPDPKRSIEVWAWNPALATEESMVAWGRRGTDGGNMSFNYGSSGGAGAVTHFGQADIGWGATRPPAGQWHHLVYTYDGTTTRVYSDGVLINSEFLGEQALDTRADPGRLQRRKGRLRRAVGDPAAPAPGAPQRPADPPLQLHQPGGPRNRRTGNHRLDRRRQRQRPGDRRDLERHRHAPRPPRRLVRHRTLRRPAQRAAVQHGRGQRGDRQVEHRGLGQADGQPYLVPVLRLRLQRGWRAERAGRHGQRHRLLHAFAKRRRHHAPPLRAHRQRRQPGQPDRGLHDRHLQHRPPLRRHLGRDDR